MQRNLDLLTVRCMECDWSLQLQPAQNKDALESECPAQSCPACGTEETIIEFHHEPENWLILLAEQLHWPT